MTSKKTGVFKLIAELLIVFVGVYGAFELNRYQEAQRDNEIKESYFNSFMSELVKLSSDIRNTKNVLDRRITNFEKALGEGEQPRLTPIDLFFEAPMLITKAGFNDDVFIQLNPGLASSLSGGYDNVKIVSERVRSFNDICDSQLISSEPIIFYDKKGNLKPQFDWYLKGLKNLQSYTENLSQMINNGAIPATKQLIEDFL